MPAEQNASPMALSKVPTKPQGKDARGWEHSNPTKHRWEMELEVTARERTEQVMGDRQSSS